jgi:hypothetical protein
MERRIQRTLVDLDDSLGDLLQPLRDAVAVRWLEREDSGGSACRACLAGWEKRGDGIDTSTFDSSIAIDVSKVKALARSLLG